MKINVLLTPFFMLALIIAAPRAARCEDGIQHPFSEKLARTRALLESRAGQGGEPARIVTAPQESGQSSVWVRMIEGLALCTGIFLIGVGLVRRRRRERGLPVGKRMRIVERLPVSSRGAVILMKLDGREYLLGVGGDPVSITPLPETSIIPFPEQEKTVPIDAHEPIIRLKRAVGDHESESFPV